MAGTPWATRLWPGLPGIWSLGSWLGLAQAVGFALAVNLAVLAGFHWTELLPSSLLTLVWLAIGLVWAGSATFSYQARKPEPSAPEDADRNELFALATDYYLKGNWYEAQRALGNLLRTDPRDVEAGLMWATVLRHAGRVPEALEQLSRLECFDGHQKWGVEIRRERELIQRLQRNGSEHTADDSAEDPPAEAA